MLKVAIDIQEVQKNNSKWTRMQNIISNILAICLWTANMFLLVGGNDRYPLVFWYLTKIFWHLSESEYIFLKFQHESFICNEGTLLKVTLFHCAHGTKSHKASHIWRILVFPWCENLTPNLIARTLKLLLS